MLRRNLLYSPITRGRQLVVDVGSKCAIGIAVRTSADDNRNTGFAERLRFTCSCDAAHDDFCLADDSPPRARHRVGRRARC